MEKGEGGVSDYTGCMLSRVRCFRSLRQAAFPLQVASHVGPRSRQSRHHRLVREAKAINKDFMRASFPFLVHFHSSGLFVCFCLFVCFFVSLFSFCPRFCCFVCSFVCFWFCFVCVGCVVGVFCCCCCCCWLLGWCLGVGFLFVWLIGLFGVFCGVFSFFGGGGGGGGGGESDRTKENTIKSGSNFNADSSFIIQPTDPSTKRGEGKTVRERWGRERQKEGERERERERGREGGREGGEEEEEEEEEGGGGGGKRDRKTERNRPTAPNDYGYNCGRNESRKKERGRVSFLTLT